MAEVQNFKNHAKIVPAFHFFVLPILVINVVSAIIHVVRFLSLNSVIGLLVALALLVLAFCARIFALTVQDRLIRLEMRLRMQQLLPPDLVARIPEFSVAQLVSLRFAGDEELPDLARKVLADHITDRKTIKKMIRNWQGDLLRV